MAWAFHLLSLTLLITILSAHNTSVFSQQETDSIQGIEKELELRKQEIGTSQLTTYITAILSVIAVILSSLIGYITVRRTRQVEYEYNAKQRIYNECLPHLFRFIRKAERWQDKFRAIVNHAKNGDINMEEGRDARFGHLNADNYFKVHTFYLLFAPIAAFKIFEENLTALDLNLDKNVAIQYKLGKSLYYSFSRDNDFAEMMNKAGSDSQKYKRSDNKERQGMRGYEIDVISPFFIKSISEKERQLKTFEEFRQDYEKVAEQINLNQDCRYEIKEENQKKDPDTKMSAIKEENQKKDPDTKMSVLSLREFATLNTIFYKFDPTKWDKPILWRILLYYTMLCELVVQVNDRRQVKGSKKYLSDKEVNETLKEVISALFPEGSKFPKGSRYQELWNTCSSFGEQQASAMADVSMMLKTVYSESNPQNFGGSWWTQIELKIRTTFH